MTTTKELEAALVAAGETLRLQNIFDEMFEQKLAETNRLNAETIQSLANNVMSNTSFLRKIRDWTVSSIDTTDIRDNVLDKIDFSVLAEIIMSNESYGLSSNFHQAIMSNTRFRAVVDHCVQSVLNNYSMQDKIDATIHVSMANVANEAAEKAINIFVSRMTNGADV